METFVPLRDGEVRIYVCGMTPSARAHLGHARSFLFFDVLRRYLTHRGYKVTFVQNVTDIDDRSIDAGRQTGENYHAIIDRYYAEFKASMRNLGVLEYDAEPYATQYVPQIQRMIGALIERGHAYATSDGIYYRVSTFPNYGKLANRNIEELEAGARIEVDEQKEDPLDFALWKFAKPGEPKWAFDPYGEGRPGWHIECSAMSHELLDPKGEGFDIHGGGADLIFPHHENEIAQSEPLMSRPPMANFWVHGGLLLFDSRKMSKSLGNFEPLSTLLERYDPQAVRLLFLQTGYRKVMNFTDESIAAASAVLRQLKKSYRLLSAKRGSGDDDAQEVLVPPKPTDAREAAALLARIEAALDDDMNTSVALAELLSDRTASFETFTRALTLLGIEPNESWLQEAKIELPSDFVAKVSAALSQFQGDPPLALDGATPQEAVERIIELRAQARARKDWAASDRLRDALLRVNVELHDSKEGTTWSVSPVSS
ncbi:MAG: cysteine--tRNA ligase [Candidatus Eremiobacteraeota bacterium]|nr:cysteine--tRNA ligase [Candidatus Eremiobacteraeota bacterium]